MSNLSGVIKSIRNDMREDRGISGDGQRIEQLGWMLFLKIFDDKDKELELLDDKYKSPIPEKFKWRNWAADDEGITGDALLNFVDQQLYPTLKELSALDPRAYMVREVFEGNNNYMKSGINIRKVLNKLNEIDFNIASERHLFGELYETILQELQNAGDYGEFYTPRAVTQFITGIINPQLDDKILDPACGTGGFLTSAIEHLKKQTKNIDQRKAIQKNVQGWEWKPLPYVLATTNLILHDIELPDITYRDALDKPLSEYREKDRVNIIIANPPFGGTVANNNENNFPQNYRTKESADLFLILMIQLLKQGGRAGIVLPDGSLSGDGVKQRIRQKLLEECNLHTIIRLPNSVFKPYATVATNLLFFDKGTPTKEVWYYQHNYLDGVKSYNKTNPLKLEELEPIRKWWEKRVESEVSWKVSIDTIIERGFDLDIKNPHQKAEESLSLDKILFNQKKSEKELKSKSDYFIQELSKLNCREEITFLLEHFDTILKVDKSITQLKSVLLNLGVRGKLTDQHLNDGKTTDLLEKIKTEKVKLLPAKKLKKGKELPPIKKEEIPFCIPKNWTWCRLGEICNYGNSPKAEPKFLMGNTWVLDLEDIEKESSRLLCKIRFVERNSLSAKSVFKKDQVLYSKLRPYLDKVIVADEDGVCTTEILPLKFYGEINPYFMRYALKRSDFLSYVSSVTKGMKMPRLGTAEGQMALIPLPPLPEQHRIVNKLEQLMELCDELQYSIQQSKIENEKLFQGALRDALKIEETVSA